MDPIEHPKTNRGQAIVFLLVAMVILVFVVLWNFDVHKILHVKSLSQNAGDSAALVAARWQGITLNLIGDLNVMQAIALAQGDPAAAGAITSLQARLCLVGPMIALEAAQQAAKNNRMYANPAFTGELRAHARRVRTDYLTALGPDGTPLFPEPYPDAWQEYAGMLEAIADNGVAAGPDNARYYTDTTGGHLLLTPGFYDAIAGRAWCWFYHHAPTLLEEYDNFFPCWWPPLPDLPRQQYINSEFFGLGLATAGGALSDFTDVQALAPVMADRGLNGPAAELPRQVGTWYCYGAAWSTWDAMATTGPDAFPLTGTVKPQYDYAGADAAVRIEAETTRLTPGAGGTSVTHTIVWTAAAKPFGYLNETDRPNAYTLVLPAFREVRLIPVDAASSPAGGAYNLEWRRHIEEHLPDYLENGPGPHDCWYCEQLATWEDPDFRQAGVDWLALYSDRCIAPGPGGGSRGGGTRRGH